MRVSRHITRSAAAVIAAGLLLAACSTQAGPATSSAAPSGSTSSVENSPLRGKTLSATFQPDWGLPLAALDANGKPEGFIYEIVSAAAAKLGATLKVSPNDFSTTIPGVQSGKYDVGLGTDATLDRQKVVDIVSTTLTGYQFVTVSSHADLPADLSGFGGLKVAVIAGSSYIAAIQKASDALVAAGKPAIEILTFPDNASSVLAVQSGRADATLRYDASAGYIAKQDSTWKVSGPAIVLGQSGFSVKKGSGTADLWRQAVDAIIADGTYATILARYNIAAIAIDHSTVNPAQ